MRSITELFEEAKWGQLTEKEIAYVAQKLSEASPGNDNDLDKLIYILGRIGAHQYRKLIEPFLFYPSDPEISGVALYALCGQLGYAQDFLKEMKAFIRGVEWDDGHVKLRAISRSGEFLRRTPEKELLELLVEVYEATKNAEIPLDEEYSDESLIHETVFIALARAVGKEWKELLHLQGEEERPLTQEFISSIIEKAHQIIQGLK